MVMSTAANPRRQGRSTGHPTILGTRRLRSRSFEGPAVSAWFQPRGRRVLRARAGAGRGPGDLPATAVVDLWGARMVLGCRAPFWTWRTVPARWPASGVLGGGSGSWVIMLRPWTSRYSDPSARTGACKTARCVRAYTWGIGRANLRIRRLGVRVPSGAQVVRRAYSWLAMCPSAVWVRCGSRW